jgi:hypothetical protein
VKAALATILNATFAMEADLASRAITAVQLPSPKTPVDTPQLRREHSTLAKPKA